MKSPRVAIVILNWNGWSDTEECLQSLFRIEYSNYFVVLIDNGSLYPPRDLNPSDTGTAQMVLP
ncbi:MAG: glycosyltransferase family 2 protein, partial [Nitrospinota bacterium]